CLPTEEILDRVDQARIASGQAALPKDERDALAAAIESGLTYARYGLYRYVKPSYQDKEPYINLVAAGVNLRGLMRILLFKRLESSVEAFRSTCRTLTQTHEHFARAMDRGRIPAGQEMQRAIYDLGIEEASASEVMEAIEQAERKASSKYDIKAFDAERLRADLVADSRLFSALHYLVSEIGPKEDAKLQRLNALLADEIGKDEKVILFTQFEDTARYLYDQFKGNPEFEWISGAKDTAAILARFAPRSNPGLERLAHGRNPIRVLISTDVLSEGQNLQDAHCVVNYDLHFNPVRLIQRFGRIDRLTPYFPEDDKRSPEEVWAWNFFPETELDTHLELKDKIRHRVEEMRRVIGQDAPVLYSTEEIDEDGVIRLYSGDGTVAQEEDDDLRSPLADAEQLIRDIQRNRPDEYERIAELPDGVRSARLLDHDKARFFVYCRAGDFHQLYLADADGEIVSSDLSEGLEAVECEEEEPRQELPSNINAAVTRVKRHFDRIVREMQARRQTRPRPTAGQRYALDHLREQRMTADPDDRQSVFDPLIEAFQRPVSTAIRRRLNFLRSEKLEGEALLRQLRRLYTEHRLYQAN
ncbi:MAG: SWF/SNF helicase family protein, partial [candidate division WS1 bacterium]|nr:SWF/SNF helicase family protein [candidate division WS1 bacterium]